jgi:hypothetical protein
MRVSSHLFGRAGDTFEWWDLAHGPNSLSVGIVGHDVIDHVVTEPQGVSAATVVICGIYANYLPFVQPRTKLYC